MPAIALTTTQKQLALYKFNRYSITFTGDLTSAGTAIYYLRPRALSTANVSTTDWDYAVGAGTEKTFDRIHDGLEVLRSAWFAISDTVTKTIGVAET